METLQLKINGMTCQHCVMSVTKALKGVPGVSDAKVSLTPGQATVTYDPAKATLVGMKKAVEEACYRVA